MPSTSTTSSPTTTKRPIRILEPNVDDSLLTLEAQKKAIPNLIATLVKLNEELRRQNATLDPGKVKVNSFRYIKRVVSKEVAEREMSEINDFINSHTTHLDYALRYNINAILWIFFKELRKITD